MIPRRFDNTTGCLAFLALVLIWLSPVLYGLALGISIVPLQAEPTAIVCASATCEVAECRVERTLTSTVFVDMLRCRKPLSVCWMQDGDVKVVQCCDAGPLEAE